MNGEAGVEADLSTIPLLNAVFCVDCETITNSQHDACTVCGSPSLISLGRTLGGTLRQQRLQRMLPVNKVGSCANQVKFNLELTANVGEIRATDLNHVMELLCRLAEVAGKVKCIHMQVQSVEIAQTGLHAA